MKNILVTGGCGFIGANFIRYLLEESEFSGRIINLDKLTYAGNPENLKGIDKKFGERYFFVKADICDQKDIVKQRCPGSHHRYRFSRSTNIGIISRSGIFKKKWFWTTLIN